jgi:predicted ATPase
LEELIRAAAEGRHDETPQTILAMLQARVGQLPPSARQILRAASVFGETFWVGGVAALLQRSEDAELRGELASLIQRELLSPCSDSRYPKQEELRFRHTLMRDAAYSLLTEEDRVLGHRLAGAFLEAQEESESAVLAEHARRGQELPRAVRYYSRAAEEALRFASRGKRGQ